MLGWAPIFHSDRLQAGANEPVRLGQLACPRAGQGKIDEQVRTAKRSTIPAKHYWRLTLRSAPVLGFALLGQWREQIRIFRWKWLAKGVARRHKFTAGKDILTDALIERYVPGANVITVNSARRSARENRKNGKA